MGVGVTLWMVWNVRRLRDYAPERARPRPTANTAPACPALAVPQVPGELGDLARAMDRMRVRLEARPIEGYVRALTHELKARGRHSRRGRVDAGRTARRRPRPNLPRRWCSKASACSG